MKFANPSEEWKIAKVFQLKEIYHGVDTLKHFRDIKGFDAKKEKAPERLDRAVIVAVHLGFFKVAFLNVPEHQLKEEVDAHLKTWIPDLMKHNFVPYMAELEGMLGTSELSPDDLFENFKKAKSAALNGKQFSEVSRQALSHVIRTRCQSSCANKKQGSDRRPGIRDLQTKNTEAEAAENQD